MQICSSKLRNTCINHFKKFFLYHLHWNRDKKTDLFEELLPPEFCTGHLKNKREEKRKKKEEWRRISKWSNFTSGTAAMYHANYRCLDHYCYYIFLIWHIILQYFKMSSRKATLNKTWGRQMNYKELSKCPWFKYLY